MPQSGIARSLTLTILVAFVLAACGQTQGTGPGTQPTDQPEPTSVASEPTSAPAGEPTQPPANAQPTTATAPSASGGTLRVGRTAAPDSLNPGAGYLTESFDIWGLAYDTLIATDLRNKAIPQLAKEWSVSEDGKTWTFKLHEGAQWHDGQPLTAEDVAFTYTMIAGFESFALQKTYTELLVSAEAVDPLTAQLTFEGPIANGDERFSAVFILPKHIWEKFEDEKSAIEFENTEVIGSGPFKMAEYKPGEFTRLVANKEHYLDAPQIDEVIFQVYQNDDALVQALKTNEVDLISPEPTVVRALQQEPNIKVEIGNALSLTDIIFNVVTQENCPAEVGKCTGHPALQDVRVRQALAHATDKEQLIVTIKLGLAAPGLSLIMPGHGDAYAKDLPDYAFDIEQAKKILEDAGYTDTDGDGIREMPGDPSKPLSLRFSWPSDQITEGARIGELLRDTWIQAGVQLNLQPLESDALTSICCPAFDFDVILWGWGAGVDPSSLLVVTTTKEITTGTSESGYSNPEYDQLYDEQGVTTDKAKRIELFHKMQEILHRDVPYIIPYYAQAVRAYRSDNFQGWVIDPEGLIGLDSRISIVKITAIAK